MSRQYSQNFLSFSYIPQAVLANLAMAERSDVDQSSPHPSLTSNPVQVPMQNGDIQEMDKDNAQKKAQLYFHNCTVHLGSSDINNITIRDSGNNIPQVTCSSILSPLTTSSCNSAMSYYSDHHPRIIGRKKSSEVPHLQPPAVSNNGKSERITVFPKTLWMYAHHFSYHNFDGLSSAHWQNTYISPRRPLLAILGWLCHSFLFCALHDFASALRYWGKNISSLIEMGEYSNRTTSWL